MLLLVEIFFIVLLTMMLFTLYHNERETARKLTPHAAIEEYWTGKERRQHVRFEKSLTVDYTVEKKPHLKTSGATVDISEGGMKLIVNEKLPKGAVLDFKIALSNPGDTAEVEGEVVWSEDAGADDASGKRLFYSGIKFSAIKQPAGKNLIDYIHSVAVNQKGA